VERVKNNKHLNKFINNLRSFKWTLTATVKEMRSIAVYILRFWMKNKDLVVSGQYLERNNQLADFK